MATNDSSTTSNLLFVLTIEPETTCRRWRARLVQHRPGAPEAWQEFDNPLELARYVARLSIPVSPGRGLR